MGTRSKPCFGWLPPLGLSVLLWGCIVSEAKYDAAVKDANDSKQALAAMSTRSAERVKADDAQIAALKEKLAEAATGADERDQKISQAGIAQHNLQADLDEATAMNQQLRAELTRLGKNVDQLLSEKGVIAHSLDEAKARLEELRKAQAAAEARQRALASLAVNLKDMVQAGQLSVVTRNGVMVLVLPADLLFDGGRADVKAGGQKVVKQIAAVLRTLPDR